VLGFCKDRKEKRMTLSNMPSPSSASSATVAWPPALDALQAAPRHHKLIFENDRVRVVEARIPSGDRVPVHTHRWPSLQYVLSWSDWVRYDPEGNVLIDTRVGPDVSLPGTARWSPAIPPHSVLNVGSQEIHIIMVELKSSN
jgi:hypothetical protein